jgi:hypothetical protein
MGLRSLALAGLALALIPAGPAGAGDPAGERPAVDARIARWYRGVKAQDGVLT